MKKSKLILLVLFIGVFFIFVGCSNKGADEICLDNNMSCNLNINNDSNILTGAELKIKELYQPDRDSYGYVRFNGNLIKIRDLIEKEIPPLPDDFWKEKYTFINVYEAKDLCSIDEKYYLQPEWIGHPSKFVEIQIPYIKEGLNKEIWYREGVGGYPAIHRVETKRGEEFDLCTFIFTGWRVESYQGIKLIPYFQNKIIWNEMYDGIYLNTTNISVKLYEPNILLEPIYPFVKKGWIKKVKMHIKIGENVTPGVYALGLDYTKPDYEYDSKWKEKYKFYYSSGGGGLRSNVPIFQAIINVKE